MGPNTLYQQYQEIPHVHFPLMDIHEHMLAFFDPARPRTLTCSVVIYAQCFLMPVSPTPQPGKFLLDVIKVGRSR